MSNGFCWIEVLMEALSIALLFLLGTLLVYLFPATVLLYTLGCGFLYAGMGATIDLILTPGEPPAMLPIAVFSAAGILVGAW